MGLSVAESAWNADTLDGDAGTGADDGSWASSWALPARNAAMPARSANSKPRVWTPRSQSADLAVKLTIRARAPHIEKLAQQSLTRHDLQLGWAQ